MEPTNEEVTPSGSNGRRTDLSLQIPHRPVGFGSSRSGKGLLHSRDFSKGSSSLGAFLRGLSLKNKVAAVPDGEKSSLLSPDPRSIPESPVLANFLSALSWKRCTSLPVTPASNLSPSISTPASARTSSEQHKSHKGEVPAMVSRSLSVPGGNVVIVRSRSFPTRKEDVQIDPNDGLITPVQMEDGDEEIPEEESICRICYDVCEEGNTLKMECSCKGDLRLIHEECAVKWFSSKGNKKCDVCGQEVSNLPVILFRVQSSAQRDNRQAQNRQSSHSQPISAWQDFVVLVLISTLGYFFFLELLLNPDMKTQAIVVAAPFSFTLGLLGSTFAVILAIRDYIWIFAVLEFSLLVIILHLFYSVLHWPVVYAIPLSSVLGFGIAIGLNLMYKRFLAWRQAQVTQNQINSSPV